MDFKVIHIGETDSTNRWLREWITHGVRNDVQFLRKDCTSFLTPCVIAEYQTAGRGCGTNSWESERGMNLTFSMLIHPENLPANRQFYITEVTSVALCETLEHYLGCAVEVKWPNDIYVGDQKICGMLIENTLQGSRIKDSIIGIGLNVNQTVFESDAPNPVSMRQLAGRTFNREEVLHAFFAAFDTVLTRQTASLDYRDRLYRRVGAYLFKDERCTFRAEIASVLPDGHLRLLTEDGELRTYAFKEVQFII